MKKILTSILLFVNCFIFADWKHTNILVSSGERVEINYNTNCIYNVFAESHYSIRVCELNKEFNIVDIIDNDSFHKYVEYTDYSKIMSIGKYYGGIYGKYKDMDFEVIPCYNYRTNKSNVYLILYK